MKAAFIFFLDPLEPTDACPANESHCDCGFDKQRPPEREFCVDGGDIDGIDGDAAWNHTRNRAAPFRNSNAGGLWTAGCAASSLGIQFMVVM